MTATSLDSSKTVQRDSREFMRLAREHYENFPVGSVLVPRAQRKHVHRIYAFARTADDIADELRDAEALATYRAEFLAHLDGAHAEAEPLFADLAATIRELDLPTSLFTDLLDAFAQDLDVGRYVDERSLFDYCKKSADPVGRLVLRVFGHRDAELDRLSDSICTALQLLNHLQDLRSDLLERDRIYFPSSDLARFGVDEAQLRAPTASPQVRALVAHWLDRTASMLAAGWPLMQAVRGRLRLELRAIVGGAAAVVRAIRRVDHDVLGNTCRVGTFEKLSVLCRALTSARLPRGLA